LFPETATICCRFVAVFRNNLLPFSATICCQCGQAFTRLRRVQRSTLLALFYAYHYQF